MHIEQTASFLGLLLYFRMLVVGTVGRKGEHVSPPGLPARGVEPKDLPVVAQSIPGTPVLAGKTQLLGPLGPWTSAVEVFGIV